MFCLFVCLFVYLLILFNLTESKLQKVANRNSPNARESKTVLDTGFYAVNLELQFTGLQTNFLLVESRMQEIFACEIQNLGLWNTEYSSRNPESHLITIGIRNPNSTDKVHFVYL